MQTFFYTVRNKPSGLFLRMTKFDPSTQEPLYGPLEAAWIADSEAQSVAQASFLGDEDHESVRIEFAPSSRAGFENASQEVKG